jgi:hypothetical protein
MSDTRFGAISMPMLEEADSVISLTLTPATAGAAPFKQGIISGAQNGFYDTYVGQGFNLLSYPPFNTAGGRTASQPSFVQVWENDYYDNTHHYMEWYLDYRSADDTTVTYFRPLFVNVWRDDNNSRTAEPRFDVGSSSGSFRVFASGVDANNPLMALNSAKVEFDAPYVSLAGPDDNEALRAVKVTSAVNRVEVRGAIASSGVKIQAAGSDTNISLQISSKGSEDIQFYSHALGNQTFRISSAGASAVNQVAVVNSTAGNAVRVAAVGSDTNIDLALEPKGTGVVKFGTHSALGSETVSGFITVKDAAGNSRKLAVVS